MTDKLSPGRILGYGTGTIGKSLSYGLANGFIMLYLTSVLKLDTGFLAVMFLLVRIWDGVNDLLMGAIIDHTRTRWGKFRPWIVIGSVTNALVAILLFWNPGFQGVGLYVYATVMLLLWDATYTMIDVGYWAMIPALTLDSRERDWVSMVPRIFGGVAGLAGAFTLHIVDALGGQQSNGGFLYYAMITSAAYVVTSCICVASAKERIAPPVIVQEKFSLIRSAKILIHNGQALVIVVIMILLNLAINLTNAVSVFYFQYVMMNKDMYATFTLLIGVSQAVGLFAFPILSKRLGRHKVYILSMALPCAGYLLMIAANLFLSGSFAFFACAAFVMSAGFGSMGVMQNVMLADAVDYGEWRTGQRNEGTIFSMLTFLSKVAGALSSFITLIGFKLVKFGGADATVATPQAETCIKLMMFGLPPFIVVAALLVYLKYFRLKPALVEQVSKEIQERRAAGIPAEEES